MHSLNNVHALIIDMDGVLWKGSQALPGLIPFFQTIRKLKIPFLLATNNASLTQKEYIDKLATMDVAINAHEILTSSMATAHYLSNQVSVDKKNAFVIGEDGLHQPLIEQGFNIINHYDSADNAADFVICGLDRQLTWEKLANASLHLGAGAKFIATNADSSLPTERGNVLGNGSILAALETATEVKATVIGKPEPIMYQQAIEILGVSAENTIAIGDRLNTDILGAVNTGIRSILVLSGISSEADLKSINYQPTWIMPDLPTITQALLDQSLD